MYEDPGGHRGWFKWDLGIVWGTFEAIRVVYMIFGKCMETLLGGQRGCLCDFGKCMGTLGGHRGTII